MEIEERFNYFKGGLALGAGIGLASGIASTVWAKNRENIHPDTILEKVKRAFLTEGPIEGSWINFEKQNVRKFAVKLQGYTGGITRLEDGKLVSYEFLADAKTGTVLDVTRNLVTD